MLKDNSKILSGSKLVILLKKNAKILGVYILGIIISMFLAVPLSPFFANNIVLFSIITAILTLGFVYVEMWKFGKYDALRKESSALNAIGNMGFYIIVTFVLELIVTVNKPSNLSIPEIIHTVWFFPFSGFYTSKTVMVVSLIVALITIVMSIAAYYMGVAGVSISDKILNARRKRIDTKAEKHFEEIEKIKEEYRKKGNKTP